MAHMHTILKQSDPPRALPFASPDPELPLIVRTTPAEFIRSTHGIRQLGRVFSQRRNLDLAVNHPTVFYVEFPANSASFSEISATKLAAILGDNSSKGPFTRMEIARILERADSPVPFQQLLDASRP